MTIAIHQPNYLPWRGYFDKMAQADTFVVFDDVQLPMSGHAYETRAVVRGSGGPVTLTVPVENRGRALIKDTKVVDGRWRGKHFKTLAMNYGRGERLDQLASIYSREWRWLLDFNLALIRVIVGWLGIKTTIVLSSALGVQGTGTEKIIGTVEALGGDRYISGSGAGSRRYVDADLFEQRGVEVVWHDYAGPNISAIDLILWKPSISQPRT